MSEPKPNGNGKHSVALWAGITAAFTNLAAINIAKLLGATTQPQWQLLGVLITSILIGGSVYAHERLNDAREEKKHKEIDNAKG